MRKMEEVFNVDKKVSAAKGNVFSIAKIFLFIIAIVWTMLSILFLIIDFGNSISFVILFSIFILVIGAGIFFLEAKKDDLRYVLKEKSIIIFEEFGPSEYPYKQFDDIKVLPFKKAVKEYIWNGRYFGKILDFTGMSIPQSPSLEIIKNTNMKLIEQYEKMGLANISGDVVLLLLKNSSFDVILLKPDDIEGFVKSIKKKMDS